MKRTNEFKPYYKLMADLMRLELDDIEDLKLLQTFVKNQRN